MSDNVYNKIKSVKMPLPKAYHNENVIIESLLE